MDFCCTAEYHVEKCDFSRTAVSNSDSAKHEYSFLLTAEIELELKYWLVKHVKSEI